jgi:DNA-binding beta-propeller fold protein YncE
MGVLVAVVPPTEVSGQRAVEDTILWPVPPDTPRIRYSAVLRNERDLGRTSGFLGRISNALIGSDDGVVYVMRPHDVFVDSQGRMYVTNGLSAGLWVFDPSAKEARLIQPSGAGALVKPMGITGDPNGNILVSDPGARRVVELDGEGAFVRAYGGSSVLLNPVDVALSPSGDRVYVADSYLHQLLVFDREGGLIKQVGRDEGDLEAKTARRQMAVVAGQEANGGLRGSLSDHGDDEPSDLVENRSLELGHFRYPAFVATAPDGTVYVSDGMNFRIQAFDPSGAFLRSVGHLGDRPGSFARPKGIAVDSEGHLYVVDAAFNNVQIFDEQGRLLLAFGAFGNGPGQLWMPTGLWIDQEDRIFVADRYNNRLQVFEYLPEDGAAALSGDTR